MKKTLPIIAFSMIFAFSITSRADEAVLGKYSLKTAEQVQISIHPSKPTYILVRQINKSTSDAYADGSSISIESKDLCSFKASSPHTVGANTPQLDDPISFNIKNTGKVSVNIEVIKTEAKKDLPLLWHKNDQRCIDLWKKFDKKQ